MKATAELFDWDIFCTTPSPEVQSDPATDILTGKLGKQRGLISHVF